MRVQSLNLVQFRNYAAQAVSFSPRKNVFLGNNGQGKTNLLEALYFLSHARSHRTTSDRELLRQHDGQTERGALVSAVLENHHYEGRTLLEARISIEDERLRTVFKLNGSPLRSRSEVLGHLPTVSFFLPDLLLLRGAPEDRRRWLDAAIVQYDKRHLVYLSEFNKIRQQKNRLLKEPLERISTEHLATWNVRFAAAGAKVIASRLAYLSMIDNLAAMAYLELSDAREHLTMAYDSAVLERMMREMPHYKLDGPSPAVPDAMDIEAVLARLLEERMPDEIRRGTSLVGPHRDDIRFALDDMAADAYGSQGQQRSVVLALKLTELQCLNAKLQEPPVLLLDDVMAELDPDRQRHLIAHIHPESQVFITTTHADGSWHALLHADAADSAVFYVSEGVLKQGGARGGSVAVDEQSEPYGYGCPEGVNGPASEETESPLELEGRG